MAKPRESGGGEGSERRKGEQEGASADSVAWVLLSNYLIVNNRAEGCERPFILQTEGLIHAEFWEGLRERERGLSPPSSLSLSLSLHPFLYLSPAA